jgi:hypothetical protein
MIVFFILAAGLSLTIVRYKRDIESALSSFDKAVEKVMVPFLITSVALLIIILTALVFFGSGATIDYWNTKEMQDQSDSLIKAAT